MLVAVLAFAGLLAQSQAWAALFGLPYRTALLQVGLVAWATAALAVAARRPDRRTASWLVMIATALVALWVTGVAETALAGGGFGGLLGPRAGVGGTSRAGVFDLVHDDALLRADTGLRTVVSLGVLPVLAVLAVLARRTPPRPAPRSRSLRVLLVTVGAVAVGVTGVQLSRTLLAAVADQSDGFVVGRATTLVLVADTWRLLAAIGCVLAVLRRRAARSTTALLPAALLATAIPVTLTGLERRLGGGGPVVGFMAYGAPNSGPEPATTLTPVLVAWLTVSLLPVLTLLAARTIVVRRRAREPLPAV